MSIKHYLRTLSCALLFLCGAVSAAAVSPDHHEFEATLYAPFTGEVGEARNFLLDFSYLDARDPSTVAWRVDLLDTDGEHTIRSWYGEERLFQKRIEVSVPWDGLGARAQALAPGLYTVRLTAISGKPLLLRAQVGNLAERVERSLAAAPDRIEQLWPLAVGTLPKVRMPDFKALPTASSGKSAGATGSLPYTVYFGNLHTQSNDSDGGGAIPGCSSSQAAQSGAFGPTDGFAFADNHGLDFSAASEHNHYFDGSSSTNTGASASVAINRYAAGVAASDSYNSSHPGFLALYGMEWGVISGGGHLNILNATELFGWESNSSGQLFGNTFVAKNDYASLYSSMRAKGFLGQFNHPASSGQFVIGSTALAYDANGDEVMVLAEVQNTSAFSSNTSETETSRSSYESAYKTLLERGYHIAPATNQDNHCANWGASWTNRTAVLIPNGVALTKAAFFDALRARRVFATSDKNSQIVLTANGHLMGERFNNSGALNLQVLFANSAGRTVGSVQILEGVPGRNGTVTTLTSSASTTITPSTGQHFYYARLVQDDGKILWSAPIWVNQGASSPNVAPTANFSFVASGLTVNFSDSSSDSDGTIASRSWNFGDGSTSTATNPSKTYASAGSRNVTLTVTDNGGLTKSITKTVTVSSTAGPFFQSTTVFNILDNTTINSPITVSGVAGNAPSTLRVSVNITHTYQGDLKVDLVAPDGTLYNIHNRTGAGTDNVIKTVTINASSEVASGTWNMRVNDNAGGDTGRLNSWSMQF
ncbi:MAG: CehA/McbA family metallohydrolase [Lysobacterales bacterium]